MCTLQSLRNATLLARFVLVCWALVTGVAIASPLAKPNTLVMVCSGAGVMQLLVNPGDGGEAPANATLDCPLCVSVAAPPPVIQNHIGLAPTQPHSVSLRPALVATTQSAAPLPARGPPTAS
jgi:hypothetical protein